MRTIKYTNTFKRDYKRKKSGKSRRHAEKLDRDLMDVVALLAADAVLPRRYADHPLTGDWKDFRDCHVRPDLILIYRKPDAKTLELVRIGSHSELGL
jgi:mRNA interferase YafQ